MKVESRGWRASFSFSPIGIALFLGILTAATPLHGQNIFSRFYRDQPTKSVVPDLTRIPQTLKEGDVYLSEQEAIEMALKYNLDVNVERHNSLASRWRTTGLTSVYDSKFNWGFNWNRQSTPANSSLAGGASVTSVLTSYDLGYAKSFSSGTSLGLSFVGNRDRTTSNFSTLVPSINTNLELTLKQNLLKGFGRIDQDYEIEISRNNSDITDQEFKRAASDVILQVQDRYWELQFAAEDIKVKEKSLELAKEVLQQNRSKLDVGSAARLDVVQSESEVASRQEELIRAQYNYKLIQDQLVKLISNYEDPRQFPGRIVPSDPVSVPAPVKQPFDDLMSRASEQRAELQQADLQTANQKIGLQQSRNSLKPSLDLVMGYQQFGLGGNQVIRDFSQGFTNPRVIDVIPGGVGDSLDQLFSGNFYGYVVGLNLQLPLSNTESRARNAEAQIALNQAEMRRRSVRQSVALEIRNALTQIEMNEKGLGAARAAVRFARERMQGEQARFNVGMATTRDLIEAQRDLVQAQSVMIRDQVDLIKSHNVLDRSVGLSFEKHHIQLQSALQLNVK